MWQQKRQERADTLRHQPQNEIMSHLKDQVAIITGEGAGSPSPLLGDLRPEPEEAVARPGGIE